MLRGPHRVDVARESDQPGRRGDEHHHHHRHRDQHAEVVQTEQQPADQPALLAAHTGRKEAEERLEEEEQPSQYQEVVEVEPVRLSHRGGPAVVLEKKQGCFEEQERPPVLAASPAGS